MPKKSATKTKTHVEQNLMKQTSPNQNIFGCRLKCTTLIVRLGRSILKPSLGKAKSSCKNLPTLQKLQKNFQTSYSFSSYSFI